MAITKISWKTDHLGRLFKTRQNIDDNLLLLQANLDEAYDDINAKDEERFRTVAEHKIPSNLYISEITNKTGSDYDITLVWTPFDGNTTSDEQKVVYREEDGTWSAWGDLAGHTGLNYDTFTRKIVNFTFGRLTAVQFAIVTVSDIGGISSHYSNVVNLTLADLPGTATETETETATATATLTDTLTATATQTETLTATATLTETQTATQTLTETATLTATDTATLTATATLTDTATLTETATGTATETLTLTATDTATDAPLILCVSGGGTANVNGTYVEYGTYNGEYLLKKEEGEELFMFATGDPPGIWHIAPHDYVVAPDFPATDPFFPDLDEEIYAAIQGSENFTTTPPVDGWQVATKGSLPVITVQLGECPIDTSTATDTATETATATPYATPTATDTETATQTATQTLTDTDTQTDTETQTDTDTETATDPI